MDIVVIGTGGLAREFSSFFSSEVNIVGFSSTNTNDFYDFSMCGKFFGSHINPDTVGTKYAVIAIGSPNAKRAVSAKLKSLGFEFPNLVHPSAISATNLLESSSEGVIISPNCVIGSNVDFANHIYLNFMVGVGHDAKFESFIQVNPGSQLGGGCTICNGTLIGSNSTILQSVKVGASVTVGSGSVVFGKVTDRAMVMGNPAKRMKSFEE